LTALGLYQAGNLEFNSWFDQQPMKLMQYQRELHYLFSMFPICVCHILTRWYYKRRGYKYMHHSRGTA